MEYEIANRADIEELYALQLRAFESEAKMIGSRSVPALMETYAHSLADFDNWTVLVKRDEGGNIIGAIRYRKIDDHVEIGRLMVAQEHRRQGVATDLLRDVEERTQERVFELYTCTKSWINDCTKSSATARSGRKRAKTVYPLPICGKLRHGWAMNTKRKHAWKVRWLWSFGTRTD